MDTLINIVLAWMPLIIVVIGTFMPTLLRKKQTALNIITREVISIAAAFTYVLLIETYGGVIRPYDGTLGIIVLIVIGFFEVLALTAFLVLRGFSADMHNPYNNEDVRAYIPHRVGLYIILVLLASYSILWTHPINNDMFIIINARDLIPSLFVMFSIAAIAMFYFHKTALSVISASLGGLCQLYLSSIDQYSSISAFLGDYERAAPTVAYLFFVGIIFVETYRFKYKSQAPIPAGPP